MPANPSPTTIEQLTALFSTPIFSAMVGGVTGILGTLILNWFTFKREKKHKAESTFVALQAEIRSIVELMEFANYERGIQVAIQTITQTNQPFFFDVPVEIELFTKVYSENVGNLGLIKKEHLPEIVSFYATVHALVMDCRPVKPLGNPPPNGIKFFATAEVLGSAKHLHSRTKPVAASLLTNTPGSSPKKQNVERRLFYELLWETSTS